MTWQCLWYPNQTPLQFCETDGLFQNSLSGHMADSRTRGALGSAQAQPQRLSTSLEPVSLPSDTALLSVTSRPVASGHTHLTTGVSEAGRSALGSLVWVFFCCIFDLDRIRLVREKEVRVYNAVFLAQHSTT